MDVVTVVIAVSYTTTTIITAFVTSQMATSMVACTALSAPIMYVSAWSLEYSTTSSYQYFTTLLHSTYIDISYAGVFCSVSAAAVKL